MRSLLIVVLAFCWLLPGSISAEENESPAVVESVISANPQPDGKAYLLSLMLKGGRRLSLEIPPAEALKIVGGLSKVAGPGSPQVVALVHSVSMQADAEGRFVLLQPRLSAGPILPLAIPIEGADSFSRLFQQKIAEARVNATKTQQHK
jgi:hypothetical protein